MNIDNNLISKIFFKIKTKQPLTREESRIITIYLEKQKDKKH